MTYRNSAPAAACPSCVFLGQAVKSTQQLNEVDRRHSARRASAAYDIQSFILFADLCDRI
jgi:hypothetical protein